LDSTDSRLQLIITTSAAEARSIFADDIPVMALGNYRVGLQYPTIRITRFPQLNYIVLKHDLKYIYHYGSNILTVDRADHTVVQGVVNKKLQNVERLSKDVYLNLYKLSYIIILILGQGGIELTSCNTMLTVWDNHIDQ